MFATSAFIAGVAGCLVAYRFGCVSDASYGVIASLTALAFAYLGGITSVSGAVTAGITAASGVAFFGMSEDGRAWDSGRCSSVVVLDHHRDPEPRGDRRWHPNQGRGRQAQTGDEIRVGPRPRAGHLITLEPIPR